MKAKKANAMIKINTSFEEFDFDVLHPVTKKVRLVIGGTDQKRYPGFNGEIIRIVYSDKVGAYLSSSEQLNKLLSS